MALVSLGKFRDGWPQHYQHHHISKHISAQPWNSVKWLNTEYFPGEETALVQCANQWCAIPCIDVMAPSPIENIAPVNAREDASIQIVCL